MQLSIIGILKFGILGAEKPAPSESIAGYVGMSKRGGALKIP
jgi:hypothetical protein